MMIKLNKKQALKGVKKTVKTLYRLTLSVKKMNVNSSLKPALVLWVFQLRALEFDIYDRTFNRQAPVWQPHLTRCPSNATGIPWILNKLEPSAIAPVCLQAGQNTGSPLRATSSC
ncbi:hypothetical protein B738_05817 [Photorhabdus temperata subsp. temperata M1021]|nr:hypothetical protein B738_05817 [Photorhabdus temperata subsp. temperata M1021]